MFTKSKSLSKVQVSILMFIALFTFSFIGINGISANALTVEKVKSNKVFNITLTNQKTQSIKVLYNNNKTVDGVKIKLSGNKITITPSVKGWIEDKTHKIVLYTKVATKKKLESKTIKLFMVEKEIVFDTVENFDYKEGKYTGTMSNGKPQGKGKYTITNEDESIIDYEATWENEKMVGAIKKVLTYYSGDNEKCIYIERFTVNKEGIYIGSYNNETYIDDKILSKESGYYKNGYKDGLYIVDLYEDGEVLINRISKYIDGVRYITMNEFKQVKIGMYKSSAENILGKGTLTSTNSYSLGGKTYTMEYYQWGDYDTGKIDIVFENSKATDISQIGIKY